MTGPKNSRPYPERWGHEVGVASHPLHGEGLPVVEVPSAHDRLAMFAVRTQDGHALAMGTLPALVDLNYSVRWYALPERVWPDVRTVKGGEDT